MSEYTGHSLNEIITRIDAMQRKHVSLCATRQDGIWHVWVEWLQ